MSGVSNSINWVELIQAIAGLLSIVIAVIAIYIAIETEKRSHSRFKEEQNLSRQIAEANVKPIISIWTVEYINLKGIKLINCGTGPAIVTSIYFTKNEKQVFNIAELFNIERQFYWDTFWTFSDTKFFIQADRNIKLVEVSLENLVKQGISLSDANLILDNWQSELEGITINIEYCDVFGNPQIPYFRTLHSYSKKRQASINPNN